MVAQIHWQNSDRASQSLVDAMIEDIGIENEQAKKASRSYALSLLDDDVLDLEMSEWQLNTSSFAEGYEQALEDMGNR